MGLVSKWRGARRARRGHRIPESDEAHLRAWAAAHHGVEAFVEPRTTVTDTTVVMVAADGSWTRRRVDGPQAARRLARSLRMPVYDVQIVGYPQRMRDHDARERVLRERRRRADLQDRDDRP